MKKLYAFLLALIMMTVIITMAGCGNTAPVDSSGIIANTEATTSQKTGTGTQDGATEQTTAGINPPEASETTAVTTITTSVKQTTTVGSNPGTQKPTGYEDLNFGGKTFVFATEDDSNGDGWDTFDEILPDISKTDNVSIAVRERNKVVENLYNCKIEMQASGAPHTAASADVTGQRYTIDFFTTEYGPKDIYTKGNCYNLLNYIDVTHDWWDQEFVNSYTLKNNNGDNVLCAITGGFALSTYIATHAIMYNRELYKNCEIKDDIYELVRTGKWTMDKFQEMIVAARNDTSGNGIYAYEDGDTIAWMRTAHATHGLHAASGMSLVDNNNGVLSFAPQVQTDAWFSVVNTAIDLWNLEGGETLGYMTIREAVSEGKVLFVSEVLGLMDTLKDADVALCVLPYPKYSEQQENYAHYVDNHLSPYSMPISVTDPELDGKFLEVFAYHSKQIVEEAFIITNGVSYAGDSDTEEMLRLVFNTRTYDPGYLWFADYEGSITNMIANGANNITGFASRFGKNFASDYADFLADVTEKVKA